MIVHDWRERRGAPSLSPLCRHWLSLATRLDNELLRDSNHERVLRDDFAGFEALPPSGRVSLKKDRIQETTFAGRARCRIRLTGGGLTALRVPYTWHVHRKVGLE